jgi:hypothetical protein
MKEITEMLKTIVSGGVVAPIKIEKSDRQYIAFENGKYIGESSRIADLKAVIKARAKRYKEAGGFDYNYLDYEINFLCKCGKKMIINGNDDWRGNVCSKCKRKYRFEMSGKL